MKRTKLPTLAKKINPCKNCGAHVIKSFDWDNDMYKWACSNCGATRYEPSAKFETRFIGADRL